MTSQHNDFYGENVNSNYQSSPCIILKQLTYEQSRHREQEALQRGAFVQWRPTLAGVSLGEMRSGLEGLRRGTSVR